MITKHYVRTAIDVDSSRLEKLVSDKLSPLQAVQGSVNGFFEHSDRINIEWIRINNELYITSTIESKSDSRSKRSKGEK